MGLFSWVAGNGDDHELEGECIPEDHHGVTDSIGNVVAEGFAILLVINIFNSNILIWFMFSSLFIGIHRCASIICILKVLLYPIKYQ